MAKIGRPTENPAKNQFRIRLSDKDSEKLKECAKALNKNMSEVVRIGIDKVYSEIKKAD